MRMLGQKNPKKIKKRLPKREALSDLDFGRIILLDSLLRQRPQGDS